MIPLLVAALVIPAALGYQIPNYRPLQNFEKGMRATVLEAMQKTVDEAAAKQPRQHLLSRSDPEVISFRLPESDDLIVVVRVPTLVLGDRPGRPVIPSRYSERVVDSVTDTIAALCVSLPLETNGSLIVVVAGEQVGGYVPPSKPVFIVAREEDVRNLRGGGLSSEEFRSKLVVHGTAVRP